MTTEERLRRLAREATGLGTDADRARLLVERVRAGALPAERLALAALLGHPLACLALGRARAAASDPCFDDPCALLARLDLGPEARTRVALAAARLALERPEPSTPASDDLRRVHAGLTEWLRAGGRAAPPAEPRRHLVSVKFARNVPASYRACYVDSENLARHLARAARDEPGALDDALRVVNGARRWATREVAALARERGDWTEWWAEAGPAAGRVVSAALRREAAPWALGEPDPPR